MAGILFSLLAIVSYWLLWIAVPAAPQEPGAWLQSYSGAVTLAVNLLPFSGVGLLWFIGVLRDRIGPLEDRFFAMLGSGLLFIGMLFIAAAIVGATLVAFAADHEQLINSATYHFARTLAYNILNIYMIKMAAVLMISTSTVIVYTALVPRGLAIVGFGLALLLLFGSYYLRWSFFLFPLWVLLLSGWMLFEKARSGGTTAGELRQ